MSQPFEPVSQAFSALVLVQPESSRLANKVLQFHGFEVKEAGDAASASELRRLRRFDLGVYDDSIQGGDGVGGRRAFLFVAACIYRAAEERQTSVPSSPLRFAEAFE
jgi:hypothetical protein